MNEERQITVHRMRSGQSGRVVQILGGHGHRRGRGHGGRGRHFAERLHALGIRPGVRITKVSAMFLWGPAIVQVGQAQVAIGFGMASRIVVEVD